jgi:hypothetical protein
MMKKIFTLGCSREGLSKFDLATKRQADVEHKICRTPFYKEDAENHAGMDCWSK